MKSKYIEIKDKIGEAKYIKLKTVGLLQLTKPKYKGCFYIETIHNSGGMINTMIIKFVEITILTNIIRI